ncbi:hypothetical protein V1507DRAFT_456641 [Lipomyces tetrasporus]
MLLFVGVIWCICLNRMSQSKRTCYFNGRHVNNASTSQRPHSSVANSELREVTAKKEDTVAFKAPGQSLWQRGSEAVNEKSSSAANSEQFFQ